MNNFTEEGIVYLPIEDGQTINNFRPFLVGTKKVIKDGMEYRIVCATCDGGGSNPYRYRSEAIRVAIRLSGHPCQCEGCNAK